MKKFYLTLAVAALTTASALAIQPKEAQLQVFEISDGKVPSKEVLNKRLKNHGVYTETALGKLVDGKVATGIHTYSKDDVDSHLSKFGVKANKIRKAEAAKVADVTGEYEVNYMVELQNGSPYNGTMDVTEGSAENTVVFNFPFINGENTLILKLTGTLNTETGEITISANQASGFTGASVSMKHWGGSSWTDIDQVVVTYKDNAIVFDEDDAIGLMASTGGYYTLFDMITMEKVTENPDPGPGVDHGKGTTVSYINCYKPLFSNWDPDKTLTQVVYVTTYEDNYVEIDGLGGVGVEACKGDSYYTKIVNLNGTYNPATKIITIPAGQVLGKYNGQDINVYVGSTEGGNSIWKAPIEFTINEEGQLVCSGTINTQDKGEIPANMIYYGISAGGIAGMYTPVLNKANGNIKYDWMTSSTNTGTIDEPFYYAVVTKGKKKTLLTSNLANRAGEGYSVEFAIDETAKTATATNAATYNSSSTGNFILQSSVTGSSSDLTSTVVANIADLKNIVLPAEGYWTCMTSGGTYFGWNYPAAITGTPLYIELPDDADPEKPVVAGIHYSTPAGATTAEVIGCDEGLTDLNIPAEIDVDGVKYPVVSVAEAAFQANKTITSITIPASIKTVGNDAFRNVTNLKALNIADLAAWCAIEFYNGNANPIYNVFPTSESKWGTVTINGEAVTTSLVIPEGFTSLGRSFYGFKSLTEISLPSTLVTIGDQCFANCTKLTDVVIPAAVNYVGSCFFGCSGLKSITSLAVVPPTSKLSGFYSVDKTIPVKVPAGSVDDYKAAAGWDEFTNIIANETSLVEEVESADMESAIYFDLSGRKVSGELSSGLYIRVQGNKATKVMVK